MDSVASAIMLALSQDALYSFRAQIPARKISLAYTFSHKGTSYYNIVRSNLRVRLLRVVLACIHMFAVMFTF